MLNAFLLATLALLAAGAAAFRAGRASLLKERAALLLGEAPTAAPSLPSRLRGFLGRRDGVPPGRGPRLFFLAAMGFAIFTATGNAFLAALPWPAFVFLQRALEAHRKRKAEAGKEEQLLEFVDSLNQSLRSGLSLQQSLEACVEDVGEEMRGEVLEVLKELRLGERLEEAMSRAAASSTSPSLKLTFTVLALMHGRGGDLPRILERLRKRVAEGLDARREARILTSQSRASGYLVSSLPAVFLLLQAALNPRSLRPLLASATGNLIIVAALALNAAAFLLIRKIVSPGV